MRLGPYRIKETPPTPVAPSRGFCYRPSVSEGSILRVQRLHPEAQLPTRATAGASGLDLYACLPDGELTLSPDPVRVPTGLAIEDNCIGSGCELCIQICPFDALELGDTERQVGDFFGVAVLNEKRCTGCRLCEEACGWGAIYIDPPREMLKKDAWPEEEPAKKEPVAAEA